MIENRIWRDRARYALLGAAMAVGILFLLGTSSRVPPPLHYGRYQISTWATRLGENSGTIGAFVIDTATGEVKTAYSATYGIPGDRTVSINNLQKPFGTVTQDTRPTSDNPHPCLKEAD